MSNFIKLPNGDSLHKDSIRAIRLGDPQPKGENTWECELKPRVIIDFIVGEHGNCIVINCDSVKERDELAAKLELSL
jgi:hypothetical protein